MLQEIARAEDIKVTDREMLERVAAIAHSRRQPLKKFIKDLQDSGRLPGIRSSLLISKAIDFLVTNATVEETEPTPADTEPDSHE